MEVSNIIDRFFNFSLFDLFKELYFEKRNSQTHQKYEFLILGINLNTFKVCVP